MTRSPCTCFGRENWPRPPYHRCSCGACRRGAIDDLVDRSLSVALAHAQNRIESEGGRFGDELTVDKDLSVIWTPRQNLAAWQLAPSGRPGDTPPNRPGQFVYKLFLGSDPRPLYLGR